MKRILFTFALLATVISASAQKYEPNTKWPYVYPDFLQGTIYFQDNQKQLLILLKLLISAIINLLMDTIYSHDILQLQVMSH